LPAQEHIERARRELERLSHASIERFTAERNRRFRQLLAHHAGNTRNGAYAELLRSYGLDPGHLPTAIADIDSLPLVDRRFLMEANYVERPAVPPEQIRCRVGSSGTTTGTPLRIPISYQSAWRFYGELFVRCHLLFTDPSVLDAPAYHIAHYTPDDMETGSYIGQLTTREVLGDQVEVGCTRDPLEKHLQVLFTLRPVSSATSPHCLLNILAQAEARGIDLQRCSLRVFMACGAPLLPDDYDRLVHGFGLQDAAMSYIASEFGFVAMQREYGGPYVVFDDDYVVEILDAHGHHVAPGERGQIAITSFASDAAPMIRYLVGDEATYLGRDPIIPNLSAIADIGRSVGVVIGGGKVAFDEVMNMSHEMTIRGAPAMAVQLALRKTDTRLDQVIIRVESPSEDIPLLTRVAIDVFRLNHQMDYLISNAEIPVPIVEVYRPGELRQGRFKLRAFVDESDGTVASTQAHPEVA